ncbi:MAG: SDR family oxidoreductase [Candidatus Caenarcaniphilales bacterium]|nr:SDR family oxidoreductase [Candidatus Caenarcaniphilales bacterium]
MALSLKNKLVLITGASSGIGEATAKLCDQLGARLILIARREDKLKALANSLQNECLPIKLDVRNREEVENTVKSLAKEWQSIDVLINNAGLSKGLNRLHEAPIDDWEAMIDTNIKGLLYLSKAIIPGMVERQKGHIVNLGSIAGHQTYPGGNVYCATKAAVKSISEAMKIDLLGTNIRVTSIDPGMVETEFSQIRFDGDKERASKVYEGLKPLTGEDIADAIVYSITRPEHVNIQDMIIFPTAQASATLSFRNNKKAH